MDSTTESETSSYVSWVHWYCTLPGNNYFCEVNPNYLRDPLNLTGLEVVANFQEAYHAITDIEYESESDINYDIEMSAKMLYGLVHSRYILTNQGVEQMIKKFKFEEFGKCPRAFCDGQAVLPVGLSDKPGEDTVKLYCPKCVDVYKPKLVCYHEIDGAFFGTGFPQMALMIHPEMRPLPPEKKYEPRIYGFKLHPSAFNRNIC